MDNKLGDVEVKLNPVTVTYGDIGTLNFVINCIRQVESVLDIKKNDIENKKKYTRQDLATIDLVLVRINEMGVVLKHQRDVMVERLNLESPELYDRPDAIPKGMNIQDF